MELRLVTFEQVRSSDLITRLVTGILFVSILDYCYVSGGSAIMVIGNLYITIGDIDILIYLIEFCR
jgi:hypothetical protein